jgi:hypothetical protein
MNSDVELEVSSCKILNISSSSSLHFQANKIGLTPFFCHNGDHLTTPPPAHCGIPPYQIDPKTMGKFALMILKFKLRKKIQLGFKG